MQRRLVGVLGERGQELAPRIDIEPVAQHIARAYERDARRRIARQRSGHEAIERFAYASRRARGQDLEFDLLPRLPRRFELPRVANPGLEGGDEEGSAIGWRGRSPCSQRRPWGPSTRTL